MHGSGDCLFQSIAVSEAWADKSVNLGYAGGAARGGKLRVLANDLLCPGGAPSPEPIAGTDLPVELIIEPRGTDVHPECPL